MLSEIGVECLAPRDLDDAAQGLWGSFRAADPRLSSPYFDLRYVQAAADVVPGAEVAVIRCADQIIGFLPFQRRGTLIQPIGAPLTDYHGLLAAPGRESTWLRWCVGRGAPVSLQRFGGRRRPHPRRSATLDDCRPVAGL